MKRSFTVRLSSLCVFACALTGYPGQGIRGTISGTVLDAAGSSVPSVRVHAGLLDNRTQSSIVQYVETDQNGHFTIDNLELGTYLMSTAKEEAGYPDTLFDFYRSGKPLRVVLSPQSPVAARITITLGPKAATLSGTISNAVTGVRIPAGVRLWRIDSPNIWFNASVSPTYSVQIPSGTAVGVQFHAPGYADWYYPGVSDASKAAALSLDASKTANIDVQLQQKPE
jgi:hypothetical protein